MVILVWGTGGACTDLVDNWLPAEKVHAFVDSKPRDCFFGKRVILPDELPMMQFDALIIANSYSKEIYEKCVELGLDLNKVIFPFKSCVLEELNKNYDLATEIFGEDKVNIIKHRTHVIASTKDDFIHDIEKYNYRTEGYYSKDYVRIRTFEFLADEIKTHKLSGNVAELGVFRGEFSRYINEAFPEKTLYLFDTFEGFEDSEAEKEKNDGTCNDIFIEFFKETSLETVLEQMPHREKIVVKKGYFPDSLDGLEDTFAFVSIDVDFGESIYNGLKYFYPRLVPGGYIMIHDYNSYLTNVKKAVYKYEQENGGHLAMVPICDECGSVVITKMA